MNSLATSGRIAIVGVGGLGAPAAVALARADTAGSGLSLILVDPESVELSNLARQIIFTSEDIGRSKVAAAARRLRAENPAIEIEAIANRLDPANAAAIIARADFIIDGTDDPATKFLINDLCVAMRKPFCYGGVLGWRGQALTVIPGHTACLRCLFEEGIADDENASCRDAGIVGPVAGVIGTVQAGEALALLRGATPALAGRMLTYDAEDRMRMRTVDIARREGCLCSSVSANRGSDEDAATTIRN